MEFSFNINNVLTEKITKLRNNLLPENFHGDHRSAWDFASKISDILNEMGRASANAQGLQKAITSGERLRNSDHVIYLLIDPNGGKRGQGTVVGLLKVGRKKLFVFDATGAYHEMQPLCVLDFYVHESKQRMGCGKTLYEYMLREENALPQHLAIDRPSVKFLGFLYKHYGLQKILPQTNNFVVFDGFFIDHPDLKKKDVGSLLQSKSLNCFSSELPIKPAGIRNNELEEPDTYGQPTLYGRYAAHKPASTIGKILQNAGSHHNQQNGTAVAMETPASDCIFIEMAAPPASSCSQQHNSSPDRRDLNFSHSPLW